MVGRMIARIAHDDHHVGRFADQHSFRTRSFTCNLGSRTRIFITDEPVNVTQA